MAVQKERERTHEMAHKHNLCGRFANPSPLAASLRLSVLSLSLAFNKGSSSRGMGGMPVFLFSETVALPLPFLTFHLNSLTRRSSNPSPPLSDDRVSGGGCGWNRSSYELRQNNSQEPPRWPASHLRRNKFQRRNSETPEEEGVICYRRKRLGRRPQKKRGRRASET